MAAPAPTYDLMLMLDPKASDADRSKVRSEARSIIERDGSVVADHDYGDRALAYEIDHEKRAEYDLIQFQAPPAALDQLSSLLRISDAVTRFRIMKDRPGTPPPPDLRQAAPPPAEEAPAAADPEPAAAPEAVAEAAAPEAEVESAAPEAAGENPEPEAAGESPADEAPAGPGDDGETGR